uniref:Galanin peptides n=1 Tax=Gallus gallus TaxID=9031 RepID=A0A8V1A4G8_CHICK
APAGSSHRDCIRGTFRRQPWDSHLATCQLPARHRCAPAQDAEAKEKRGWTLNSAGYLLGPHAVDNHRSFNDKHGFTGKREIQPDEDIKAGNLGRPLADENIVRTVIEFLTYLHLKEAGALENLPSPEETNLS